MCSGRPAEPLAQLRILRRHAHGALVLVAHARHHAALGEQHGRAEGELVGAQRRGHDDVVPVAQVAVHAQAHVLAEPGRHQRPVHLGEAELPRDAGVLDRVERGGGGAAPVARHVDHVGAGLGHAGGDGADAGPRDQLDRDAGARVDHAQVVDQLREVLDRVDVVVRRRRDERDAGGGAAQPGDVRGDLVAGQLAALARLGALGDLDLELLGAGQIGGGDAEAAGGDLADLRGGPVAVLEPLQVREPRRAALGVDVVDDGVPLGVLPALARVGAPVDARHGDGDGLVRLARERAERHAAGAEAPQDRRRRLDVVRRTGGRRPARAGSPTSCSRSRSTVGGRCMSLSL